MAFLESTEVLKAIAKAEGDFGQAEMREGSNAAAKLLFANEATAFRNLKAIKQSEKQATEAILQKKTPITLANNKLAAHTGDFGDSFTSQIAFVSKSAPFKVSYKMAELNQYGYQEQLSQRMLDAMQSIREAINGYSLSQLAALKTQVTVGNSLLTWDGVNFKYTNAAGDANVAKQASRIKATARKNKYGGNLDIIGGQQLVADMVHYAAQGTANQTNYGYQFSGLSLAEEETLDEATLGANGFGYVLPTGMVGMTSWNEPLNRRGEGQVGDNQGLFTTMVDPIIPGLTYDVHVKRGVADTVAGAKTYYQDIVDEYEMTAFYTFSHALISTADETPIFAIEQL